MIKFYYSGAPNPTKVALFLEEAGLPYDPIPVDTRKGDQHKPEYLAINPKARAPALITDKGILTETPAILAFIAQSFPAAKLAPSDDPFLFAEVQAFNAYLCATLHVAHSHRMRGYRWADDPSAIAAMQRKVPESVGACFDLIERTMLRGRWVMGETYTICDPYLFTLAQWLEQDGVAPSRIPNVMAHRQRMSERPEVRKAIAEELA